MLFLFSEIMIDFTWFMINSTKIVLLKLKYQIEGEMRANTTRKFVANKCALTVASAVMAAGVARGAVLPQTTIQPSLGINYAVETVGIFTNLGLIHTVPYNFAPGGTALANGQLIPISSNSALFSQLGITFGGNGLNSFALPNLQGITPIGATSINPMGQTSGANSVTIGLPNLPTSVGGSGVAINNVQPSLSINYMIATEGVFPSQGGGSSAGGSAQPFIGEIFPTVSWSANTSNIPGMMLCQGQLLSIAQNEALFAILGTIYGGDGVQTFALPDLRGRAPVGVGTASGGGVINHVLGLPDGSPTTTLQQTNLPWPNGSSIPYSNQQPTLALHYIIAMNGIFPARDGGSSDSENPLLGEISLFAGNYAPSGWAFAEGQLLSISQNQALFALLGTTYGGDGIQTFALPDFRGRIGVGTGAGWVLGEQTGVDYLQLSAAQIPAIPEPASLGLIILGVGGILLRKK